MNKNELIQQKFENFLYLRHSKEFHIIDSPNVTFSLARKNVLKIPNFVSPNFNEIQTKKILKDKKFVSKTRYIYHNLKVEIMELLSKIHKCLSLKKIAISQFFDFEQVVLSGFMKELIDHISQQCKQKGQFLKFLWSSTMNLMKNVLQIFERNDTNNEIISSNELYLTHKNYINLLQKQERATCQNAVKIENLKNIIQLLIQKGRQKRKEIKKIIDSCFKLIQVANQVKQRYQQLETKYSISKANTILNKLQPCQIDNQTILKVNFYDKMNQKIINIQNRLFKHVWQPEIQNYFEGPMKVEIFIQEAIEAFKNQIKSKAEIQAELDTLVEKVEQDYEQATMFARKQSKQENPIQAGLQQTKYQEFKSSHDEQQQQKKKNKIKIKQNQQRCTQTTYTDKFNSFIIKTIGVTADLNNNKKIFLHNQGTQYDSGLQNNKNHNLNLNIFRVVHVNINPQRRQEKANKFRISIFDSNCSFKPQNNQINMQTQYIISDESCEKYQLNQQKINNLNNNLKVDEIQDQRKSMIKSRYSTLQSSPKKISIFQKKEKNKVLNHNSQKQYEILKNQKRRSSTQFQTNIKKQNEQLKKVLYKKQENFVSSRAQKHNRLSINFQKQNFESLKRNKKKRNQSRLLNISNINKISNSNQCLDTNQIQNIEKIHKISYAQKIRQPIKKKLSLKQIKECLDSFDDLVQSSKSKIQNINKEKSRIRAVMETAMNNKIRKHDIKQVKQLNLELQQMASIKNKMLISMRQLNLKHKKYQNQMNYRHIYNIIGSIYGRVSTKIEAGYIVQNFIAALFQSIQVLYGNIQKSDLQKKAINFLNQVSSKRNDHICKSFIFMLGLDESDKFSQMITSFDIYLYIKLINLLSHSENPLSDISQATTDFHKLYQLLPKFLRQQKISEEFLQNVILIFKKSIPKEQANENNERIQSKKFNLFYCCKTIVKLIIESKQQIRKDFQSYFQLFTSGNSTRQATCFFDLLAVLGITKNNIFAQISDIEIKKLYHKNCELEYFVECLLQLGICSFEQYYIKVLNKFEINSYQKRNELQNHKKNLPPIELYMKSQEQMIIEDILILNIAQKNTSDLIENMIGKQLGLLYSFSILFISQI